MKHITIILLFIYFFSSCINKRKYIQGCYKTETKFELGSWFCIENDSVFSFTWQCGLITGKTKGKWKVKNNKLILNSELQPIIDTTGDYKLKDKKNTNSDYWTFELFTPYNKTKLEGANGYTYIDGKIKNSYISDNEGILIIPKNPIDSIIISYIGLKEITIKPDIYDFYSIMMNEYSYDIMYEFFTKTKWIIRRNYLISRGFNVCNFGKKLKRYKNKIQ